MAIVLGVVIQDIGVVVFIVGFLVSSIFLFFYYWDKRQIAQAHTMYADYLQDVRDNRRDFLRRLDHEIKNPLTGLRAALVNLKETRSDEDRDRAVGNASRAVERLTRTPDRPAKTIGPGGAND